MKITNLLNSISEPQVELSLARFIGEEEGITGTVELIFVANGDISVVCRAGDFTAEQDDILVLNSEEKYSLHSSGCVLVILKIGSSAFTESDIFFECNSAISSDKDKYYTLKHLLARFVKISADTAEQNDYLARSSFYLLIHELNQNFKASNKETPFSKKYLERLTMLVDYINDNFRNNLSLSDIAEYAHLSVPYLSAFFDRHFGMNFTSYYTDVRLKHAFTDLMTSDESVANIALNNGFPDARAFVSAFRKKYNETPSDYRRRVSAKATRLTSQSESLQSNYLYTLAKYLPHRNTSDQQPEMKASYVDIAEKIDVSAGDKATLTHNFLKITSVGRAKELLYEDVRQMLREWQQKMGFEYIKFHGILSDDMLFYNEDQDGNPVYSFTMIDKAIDFLLSINLKPIIQFSFMPKLLASDPNKTVFFSPMVASPPSDYQKWDDMIAVLIRHWIERYSFRTISGWLFCVWNEPDTANTMFGIDKECFYQLYKHTYKVVKGFGKSLKFGSTSLCVVFNVPQDYIRDYLSFAIRENCIPDFLNIHFYDNDFTFYQTEFARPDSLTYAQLNMDENSLKKTIDQVNALKEEMSLDIPVYLTEWNLTVSHRNLLNDTCFKSCYLVKNLLENYDKLDSFAYWVLTDMIEETQPSNLIFHGGLGLYTYNGIKKPHWYALSLLTKLGNTLIKKGNGYFVTRSHERIQIVLYNYEHFNHLFASGETFNMTYTERYTPFPQLGKKRMSVELENLFADRCTVKEYIINQQYGSAFDKWLEMGACELDREDILYLKNSSVPKMLKYKKEIEENTLKLSFTLSPLEVRFIDISFR